MAIPSVCDAVVVAQTPDGYGVIVSLLGQSGGQSTFLPVQVLSHGPRDAVRGQFPELPTPGTPGVVAFTRGDIRNGKWLGSYSPSMPDASALAPGQGGTAYAAHYGGGWSWRGQDGSLVEHMPDGTVLAVGASVPVPTRHTVDAGQRRQRTPYTQSERVPQPPAPFTVSVVHPTGAEGVISPLGAWTVKSADGQPLTVESSGGTVVIDSAGNISLTTNGTVSLTAAEVQINTPLAVVSNGGIVQFVKLANGANSTVLQAQQ